VAEKTFHANHPNYTQRVQELIRDRSPFLMNGKSFTELSKEEALDLLHKEGGIIDLVTAEMDEAWDVLSTAKKIGWTMDKYFKCCKILEPKCNCVF
jgi:hypothetical protein